VRQIRLVEPVAENLEKQADIGIAEAKAPQIVS
jgi:hypothetical protein